jgi:hypothetical protein
MIDDEHCRDGVVVDDAESDRIVAEGLSAPIPRPAIRPLVIVRSAEGISRTSDDAAQSGSVGWSTCVVVR